LLFGIDTFANDLEPQGMGERDDGELQMLPRNGV
jgi:hypothetical protein